MTAKEKLQEAIANGGGLQKIRVGSRLFLFLESERAAAETRVKDYARRTGDIIYWQDGTRSFYEWTPVQKPGVGGSDRYDWHNDGDRVLQTLERVIVHKDGRVIRDQLNQAFRKLDVV